MLELDNGCPRDCMVFHFTIWVARPFCGADDDDDEDFFKEFDVEDLDIEAPVKASVPLTTLTPGKPKSLPNWNLSRRHWLPGHACHLLMFIAWSHC